MKSTPKSAAKIFLCVFFLVFFPASAHSHNNDNREWIVSCGPHWAINAFAIQAFINESQGDPVLEKYDFLEGSYLTGITVVQPGNRMKDIQGEGRQVYRWVIEGGYTADESKCHMPLRHFYDLVGANQGATYLTDHVDEWLTLWSWGGTPKWTFNGGEHWTLLILLKGEWSS